MINRALPEMLNNSLVSGNCTPADMTVLDRQQARIKWQHDQLHHQPGYFGGSEHNGVLSQLLPVQAQSFQALMDSGMMGQAVKPDPSSENGWVQFDMPGGMNMTNNGSSNNNISRTFSCPPKMAAGTKNSNAAMTPKLSLPAGKESFKKRKSDKVQNNKAVAEDDSSDKRMKGCAEEGDSKITEQHSTKNNDGESSADTSKENSKASEVAKPDYIHVRARRGQATDSHSLAERVRREKISERMKYLQDLVPGCNKITGKAGMLDEIINYVQSLQRQVEFLSMKLAAVNPRLDFNIDDLFAKEMFPANMANFQTIGMSSEITNAAYIQFNHVQQLLQCSGMESTGVTSPDSALIRRTTSALVPNPEAFLDASFTQLQPPTTWDADLQNLFNVEFQQGRTPFSSQPFTGSIEAGNLKMEM